MNGIDKIATPVSVHGKSFVSHVLLDLYPDVKTPTPSRSPSTNSQLFPIVVACDHTIISKGCNSRDLRVLNIGECRLIWLVVFTAQPSKKS